MRPPGSAKELERRRMQAIRMLADGRSPVEVAGRLGVDRRSVRRWKAAAARGGSRALRATPARGRPSRLNSQQRRQLLRLLRKGARAAGHPTDGWTHPRVARLIRDLFGVS